MANADVYETVIAPAVAAVMETRYHLELSEEEAIGVAALLGQCGYDRHHPNTTYPVFEALIAKLRDKTLPRVVTGDGEYATFRLEREEEKVDEPAFDWAF